MKHLAFAFTWLAATLLTFSAPAEVTQGYAPLLSLIHI